jgi:hypothetical protein
VRPPGAFCLIHSLFCRFFSDEKLHDVRERYLRGELPQLTGTPRTLHPTSLTTKPVKTLQDRMNLVDPRLRRVVVKAVSNSCPAARVLERFEAYLLRTFSSASESEDPHSTSPAPSSDGDNDSDGAAAWNDLLLAAPTIDRVENSESRHVVAHFHFDPDSPTGGFHRLLLHACAQFHGLEASSRMSKVAINSATVHAKLLTAKGFIGAVGKHRLLNACERGCG